MGRLIAVCVSKKRGTQKTQTPAAYLKEGYGIEGDAHAGGWHRQVSLLSYESIMAFRKKGADVDFGAFGENLVVEGFDFKKLPVGTMIQVGEAKLKLTQIGKECHSHCEIFQQMGECIMPKEGVFARVQKSGRIAPGVAVTLLQTTVKKSRPFTAAVITLSDKGAAGLREDKSGPLVKEILEANVQDDYEVVETLLLGDERLLLENNLRRLCDQRQVDVIFTTGGTGFSKRDITPEATLAVCDRMADGIAQAMRVHSIAITGRAMLSRAVSGIRKNTLIVNLPGSPKAVKECLEYALPYLGHGLSVLRGTEAECGGM